MNRRRVLSFICGFLVVSVLFAPDYGVLPLLQRHIDESRRGLLTPAQVSPKDQLIELGSTVMLGSFRTVAVVILWDQAMTLKDEREWTRLEGVVYLIAKVQPTDIEAYVFQVYNLAYNVQYDAPTVVEGWKWVKRAVEFGRQGVERNPNHPKVWRLYWQIGWIYAHRCADVGGARTRYFADQVQKEEGKSPYLVAADWYQKAFEAACRTDAAKVNEHQLSQWAYAYAHLAREMETQDNYDAMMRWRKKAVEIHQLIMDRFPAYRPSGAEAIAQLRQLMGLHETRKLADACRLRGERDKEFPLRIDLLNGWGALFRRNPAMKEAERNFDRSIDDLQALAETMPDPQRRDSLLQTLLVMRYHAATPERGSAEATDRLEHALAPFEQRLAAVLTKDELLRQKDLVRLVAGARARVTLNSPNDKERARKAEAAIRTYDALFQLLPPQEQAAQRRELEDDWLTLLSASDIDSPLGRQRLRTAAERLQAELLPRYAQIVQGLAALRPRIEAGVEIPNDDPALRASRAAASQAAPVVTQAIFCWSALLKKEAAYAEDARAAEQHLVILATALDEAGEAVAQVLGRENNDFALQARSLWQMLHEFAPANTLYLQRMRKPATSLTPTRGRGHDHGHQH